MAHSDRIVALTLEAQERVFRLAARDHGLSLQRISLESNIPYNTVRSYAGHNGEQAQMPISALNKLCGVIPDDLLSHLTGPADRHIVHDDDDHDLDVLGDGADELAAEVRRARSPSSPGGTEITDMEEARIRRKAMQLRRRVG